MRKLNNMLERGATDFSKRIRLKKEYVEPFREGEEERLIEVLIKPNKLPIKPKENNKVFTQETFFYNWIISVINDPHVIENYKEHKNVWSCLMEHVKFIGTDGIRGYEKHAYWVLYGENLNDETNRKKYGYE